MYQAISKSLMTIAALLVKHGEDITTTYNSEASLSSPLLLLISSAKVQTDLSASPKPWFQDP